MRYPDYALVDYAEGDVRRRNHVIPLRQALERRSGSGAVNSYITVYRFPAAYRDHCTQFGSVSGYAGPAYADYLPIDIDREGDLYAALQAARGVAVMLQERFDLRPDQVRYFFSGAKGFHLLIPTLLMGHVEPSPHLPRAFRSMAVAIAEMSEQTIDRKVYDVNRLFRLPDTKHTSGLWKIELTWDEFSRWNPEAIRTLARQPRPLKWEPHDLEPIDALVEFYAKHIEEAESAASQPVSALSASGEGVAANLAAALAPAFQQGQRHALTLAFAGYAAKRHLPRETALGVVSVLLEGEPNVVDPDNLPTAVNATYDRVRSGLQVKGYSELREHLGDGALAELRALLGDTALDEPATGAAAVEPAANDPTPRISLSHVYDADQAGLAYLRYVRELASRRVNIGIPSLDRLMRGLMPGTVTILLAKARVGKSAFAQNARRHIAKSVPDGATVFFSLEMPVELVWERDAQFVFEMDGRHVEERMRRASEEEAARYLAQVSRAIPRSYTVPMAGLGLVDMEAYCRLIHETFGHRISCVLVDYLSLVQAPGRDLYSTTSHVARGLKLLAKAVQAPVIMLAQVRRRGPDGAKIDGSTPPSLEDGRDSGAIEEGADYVIGAWRPRLEQATDDEIAFKLLKNRMGRAGTEVFCRMDWRTLSMTELLPDEVPSRKAA